MTFDMEWLQYQRKDGKPGHWYQRCGPEYTPLVTCDLCGVRSTPKKVQYRPCVHSWNYDGPDDYTTKTKAVLCMGCWNKVRVIVKRKNEADECRKLLKQLTRSISGERKNQDNRRTAGLSGEHDARREERRP